MTYKILILGPQGSGKGTQANLLSGRLGIPAFSMGQLLRDEIATGSDLGKVIEEIIHRHGKLVPDDIAERVLQKRLGAEDTKGGYILDGYPRNAGQEEVFQRIDTPTHVLLIDVPIGESLARLTKRAELEGRVDDTPELIRTRLDIYENDTKPILDTYRERGLLRVVDGIGTVEEVRVRILAALNAGSASLETGKT